MRGRGGNTRSLALSEPAGQRRLWQDCGGRHDGIKIDRGRFGGGSAPSLKTSMISTEFDSYCLHRTPTIAANNVKIGSEVHPQPPAAARRPVRAPLQSRAIWVPFLQRVPSI